MHRQCAIYAVCAMALATVSWSLADEARELTKKDLLAAETMNARAQFEIQSLRAKRGGIAVLNNWGENELKNFLLKRLDDTSITIDPSLSPQLGEAYPGLRAALRTVSIRVVTYGKDSRADRYAAYAASIFDSDYPSISIGSAVYLRDGYFATAGHVLKQLKSGNDLHVRSGVPKENSLVAGDVFKIDTGSIREDDRWDIAVFRVYRTIEGKGPSQVFKTPSIASVGAMKPLDMLDMAGFPSGQAVFVATLNSRMVRVVPLESPEAALRKSDIFAMGTVYSGNSGSGLFEQGGGGLIGIVRAFGDSTAKDYVDGKDNVLPPTERNCFYSVRIDRLLQLIPAQ